MKKLNEYINEEQEGSQFKDQVKYSKEDWEAWKKLIWKDKPDLGKDIMFGFNEPDKHIELIYKLLKNEHQIKHIASYDTNKEILYADDINLFGNEVK